MKNLAIISFGFIIAALFALKVFFGFTLLTESILGITALIVFWYTHETYLIRKANQEILFKSQRPVVGYTFFPNENNHWDTIFNITNLSDYPVATLVKCTFKCAGKPFENNWPEYNGILYWNLQFRETKEGHFDLRHLYQRAGYFDQDQLKNINDNKFLEIMIIKYNNDPPKLTMEVEVYCINFLGQSTFYPTTLYSHDPFRKVWITTLTADKPYWKFEQEPNWVKKFLSERNES